METMNVSQFTNSSARVQIGLRLLELMPSELACKHVPQTVTQTITDQSVGTSDDELDKLLRAAEVKLRHELSLVGDGRYPAFNATIECKASSARA